MFIISIARNHLDFQLFFSTFVMQTSFHFLVMWEKCRGGSALCLLSGSPQYLRLFTSVFLVYISFYCKYYGAVFYIAIYTQGFREIACFI